MTKRRRLEDELSTELRFHLDQRMQELVAAGMTEQEARRTANLEFGGIDQIKEECRDARRSAICDTIARDLHYAAKRLYKSPVVSFIIVSTLAIGIGSTTLIFSIADVLLLRPLPMREPENLVLLFERYAGITRQITDFRYELYRNIVDHSSTLFDAVAQQEITAPLERDADSQRAYLQIVSDNYFSALGVPMFAGRSLGAEDDHVAVLSYSGWTRYFGRDASVIGQVLRVGGHGYKVVGVTAERFNGIRIDWSPDLFVSLRNISDFSDAPALDMDGVHVEIIARLRPGVALEQARQEIFPIWHRIGEESFARTPGFRGSPFPRDLTFGMQTIESGLSSLREQFRNSLLLTLAGTCLLLLIVCSNVGGLLLGQARANERATAVRLALGAGRVRIIRQWLIESLIYAVAGALIGILLVYGAVAMLSRWIPVVPATGGDLRILSLHLEPDLRIFGFCLMVCLASTLLCAIAPAWRSSRYDLYSTLKGADERGHQRFQTFLSTAQVTLCATLLIWAGLMVRTFYALETLDPGFDRDHVVTFSLDPRTLHYDSAKIWSLQQRLLEGIRIIPEVRGAGISYTPLMRGIGAVTKVTLPGQPPEDATFNTSANFASPGYFDAMGMQLLRGRDFRQDDAERTPGPVVVNEAFVRRFFGTGDPIGKSFAVAGTYEIVGIVSNAHYRSMREPQPPIFYGPIGPKSFPSEFVVYVRTERPEAIVQPVRQLLTSIDAALPVNRTATLATEIDRSLWQERLIAVLAAMFGVFAMLLVGIGIYGVLAYFVIQYRRELGVRLALGAASGHIAQLVSKRIVPTIATGVVAGGVLYIAVASWVRSVLFNVEAYDPICITLTVLFVVTIGVAAAIIPTYRATRLDPASILREP